MLLSPLVLLAGSSLVAAAVPAPAYCAKPPYKVILVLSSYAPAQSFCSARYPQAPATTVTVTVSTTVAGLAARVPVTPAPLVKDAVACAGNCAVWSSLSKVGGSILKSACSCIQTRPTATTTVTATFTQPPACLYPSKTIENPPCAAVSATGFGNVRNYQVYSSYQGATPPENAFAVEIDYTGFDNSQPPCYYIQECAKASSSFTSDDYPTGEVDGFVVYFENAWRCYVTRAGPFGPQNCAVRQGYAYKRV